MKALGTGWRGGVAWKDFEVINLPSGRPTLQFHGKTLRKLTASSNTLNGLIVYLTEIWTSVVEEWIEVEKVRADHVTKLFQFLDEEPESKPSWWTEEYKSDYEGALLCLLMTAVSEPGVVKWFTEKFVTVV